MANEQLPDYAVFDDYRYSQRIAVVVRWFVLIAWLFSLNYRTGEGAATLVTLNGMGAALIALNGYVHWRLRQGRPITRGYVVALSVMDLGIITAGIGVTSGFENRFFVFYYPALLGLSLVFSSRRLSFSIFALVAVTYAALSITLGPGVSYDAGDDKTLIVRIASMFAVVAAGNLMTRIERTRRREAVEAERVQSKRNLDLQQRAQEAETAAQAERERIAREIHDGIAQSIYALNLSLETAADLAEQEEGPLGDRLRSLVPLAKRTLLETRYYMYDLKPLLSGEGDLVGMADNQAKEFQTVVGTKVHLSVEGEPSKVSAAVAMGFYRILQEAFANILKHAQASSVSMSLTFEPACVTLSVEDDGVGFSADGVGHGYGLENMRQRAEELGGTYELSSVPGRGTRVSVVLPSQEVDHEAHQGDDRRRPRGGASGP